jgi:hypothetical protein
MITLHQDPSANLTATYDATMMRYVPVTTGFASVVSGLPVVLTVPMSANGAAATASLIMPPQAPANSFTGTFSDAANPTISRSAATVVSWTPPTGPGAGLDLVTVVEAHAQATTTGLVVCAVPTCRGQLTIPASIVAAANWSGDVRIQAGFFRTMPIPPSDRSPVVQFTLGGTTAYQPTSVP